MQQILFSWLGCTDLRAVNEADQVGIGPIAQALTTGRFERLELLCDYPADELEPYLDRLRPQTDAETVPYLVSLPGPTDFDAIYRHAVPGRGRRTAQARPGALSARAARRRGHPRRRRP